MPAVSTQEQEREDDSSHPHGDMGEVSRDQGIIGTHATEHLIHPHIISQ